jgi:hypothetical protein
VLPCSEIAIGADYPSNAEHLMGGNAMGKCDDESPACNQDSKDYNDAAFDKASADGRTTAATSDLDYYTKLLAAAGVAVGAGLTVAALSSWTGIGLLTGLVVAGVADLGAGYCLGRLNTAKSQRDQARRDCETARAKMKAAYDRSLIDCRDADCRPAAAIPACL